MNDGHLVRGNIVWYLPATPPCLAPVRGRRSPRQFQGGGDRIAGDAKRRHPWRPVPGGLAEGRAFHPRQSQHIAFPRDGVDLAILMGRGDWPGRAAHHLIQEQLVPVCTPALAEQMTDPAGLANITPATGSGCQRGLGQPGGTGRRRAAKGLALPQLRHHPYGGECRSPGARRRHGPPAADRRLQRCRGAAPPRDRQRASTRPYAGREQQHA